ncbi:bacterial regulatory protein, arsR family [Ruminiclostridium hungatei]|uniref:Bacterial regulatory protein, arsR family n=1 Tax=Ruminiclostridium hungatei TaxID=48256 RepID=A0A1V4SRA0_RUMHU|nr:ArsR family transcriptional regulator [Ruminiclostridium hungatei]OPX45747.1 bacterial regulatory protein, arsR family [Ruminiclostridium hungatei]
MKTDISEKWLPVYEALGSDVRIKIINLLAENPLNIKQLAQHLGLSSAIVTMHVRKLEGAGIIRSERKSIDGSVQKLCHLAVDSIEIAFPVKQANIRNYHEFSMPIGHYSDFRATPTCGIATPEKVIGQFDDPRYFLNPERVNAGILWFTEGYVEYRIPNFLLSVQQPEELEISMELGSEAPGVNNNWPSDITFFLNDHKLGFWTSPGDFGYSRGKYTPEWWSLQVGQYGLFKAIRINHSGTYIDGLKVSDISLSTLDIRQKYWTFRIAVLPDAINAGGVTLFGKGFGNYSRDIMFKLFFSR